MTGPGGTAAAGDGGGSETPRNVNGNRSKLVAALAFVAIAGAGFLSGVALDRSVLARGPHGWRGGPGRMGGMPPFGDAPGDRGGDRSEAADARRKEMRDRLAKDLGLSPAQRVAVDSVMTQQAAKFRVARERVRPTMDSLVAETQQQMDNILTPEQREKMKAMRERMRSRMPRGAPAP